MDHLAPIGDVYQAGTLSGNPLAVAAGISMMHLINSYGVYEKAEKQTKKLVDGIQKIIRENNLPMQVNAVGTMFTLFFTNKPIRNVNDVNQCDFKMFNRYFHFLKDNHILLPPSQYEACFVSSEHNDKIINKTIKVFSEFVKDNF